MGKKKIYTYSNDEFVEAVASSYSIAEVLKKLGLNPAGASYRGFRKRRIELNVDISHFTGQGHLKNKSHNWGKKIPIKEIFVENSTYNSGHSLKKRIFEENFLEEKCSRCGIIEWCGEKLSLHLDHINGNSTDNRLENLRLLCPNCHSLTPTYCGRNKKKRDKKQKFKDNIIFELNKCLECNVELERRETKLCGSCWKTHRKKYSTQSNITKIVWPPLEELEKMLEQSNYLQLGKQLGVSDNAIRKHIKREKEKIQ